MCRNVESVTPTTRVSECSSGIIIIIDIIIIIIMDIFYKDCQIVRTNAKALLDEKQTKRKNKNKK